MIIKNGKVIMTKDIKEVYDNSAIAQKWLSDTEKKFGITIVNKDEYNNLKK